MAFLKNFFLLSLISGIMLWLSWYPHGFFFIVFFAFVPLFFLSDVLFEKGRFAFWQALCASFPAFFLWNLGVTWWIWNSTQPGAVAAIFLNSMFMSCVFGSWHWVKTINLPTIMVPLAFCAFWSSWEFLHLNWQINWPWLNLGNVFAATPKIVQWYEYTGTFGGTLWILIVNFLVYKFIIEQKSIIVPTFVNNRGCLSSFKKSKNKLLTLPVNLLQISINKTFVAIVLSICIPIAISYSIFKSYTINKQTPIVSIIVQQNIDPWTEQYEKSNMELAELLIQTAKEKLTQATVLMVCAESALPHTISEEQLFQSEFFPISSFGLFNLLFQQYPQLNLILGLSTVACFNSKVTPAAREFSDGTFAEFYNTSCLYNSSRVEMYHKCKLVPGVEKMPYPKLLWFLENVAVDLGGISGSLGQDSQQRVFTASTQHGDIRVGVPICYESIFGEHFSRFVRSGAQIMCVITNDAWWGDTPGYKQHFEMSRLRAIETRRYIIRAANTGISAFIDPLGMDSQKTKYNSRTVISQEVFANNKQTFYTKNGDYLARIMVSLAILIAVFSLLTVIQKNRWTRHSTEKQVTLPQ